MSFTSQTHHIPTPDGLLFAQVWVPDLAQGSPLVLLHDSLGCVALWRDFPQKLAAATGRTVIAYDRLGFGNSAAHPSELALSFVADEAQQGFAQVLQYFGLENFVVLGHSVGGGMAICCAAHYPQACQGLVTIAAQTFVEDRTIAGIRSAQQQFAQPGGMERLAKYHGTKADWVLRAWTHTWLSAGFAHWRLDGVLPQVCCPTLAIHGALDEYGSNTHPQMIASTVQGPASLEILPGCGHLPHKEQAAHCVALIAAHLNQENNKKALKRLSNKR